MEAHCRSLSCLVRHTGSSIIDVGGVTTGSGIGTPAEREFRTILLQHRGTRTVINTEQIREIMQAFGRLHIVEVELKKPTLKSQIELFWNASLYVGPHGNAVGNTFWMSNDSAVVEFEGTPFYSYQGARLLRRWGLVMCSPEPWGVPIL